MPYERLQSLFATMFGIKISQDTLAKIVREMLEKSKPAIDLIERILKESAVVVFDESGCHCEGKLNW
ncbi:MAG: transposase [Clostridium sp.]|nr:transposase [Clostridium sp.]